MARQDSPDAMPPRRRRGLSWRSFVAIVAATLVVVAAVGWIIGGRRPSSIVVGTPPSSPMSETTVPRETSKPPPRRYKAQVSSVPEADAYPLSSWNLENVSSGYIDTLTFAGAPIDAAMAGMLQNSDIVTIAGWAGDPDLGMPFHRVVFAMCDRIIGAAPVGLPRPDVAREVHPNLTSPGWTATLLIGHLPRCNGARLSAWAVAPFGRLLFPLARAIDLSLRPAGEIDPALDVVSDKLIRPEDADAPTGRILVEVKGPRINLRRCGDASCKIVGSLPQGKHAGVRLDEHDQWSLIVVPHHPTGWVASSAAKITPIP